MSYRYLKNFNICKNIFTAISLQNGNFTYGKLIES
jgi:hypothetical protein